MKQIWSGQLAVCLPTEDDAVQKFSIYSEWNVRTTLIFSTQRSSAALIELRPLANTNGAVNAKRIWRLMILDV